jgi:hypothetical protein
MPALLADLGVCYWTIGALIRVGAVGQAGRAMGDPATLLPDLHRLQQAALAAGIDVTVDDQLGALSRLAAAEGQLVQLDALRLRRLARPDRLLRLLPTGQCSIGQDILMQVRPDAPRWDPRSTSAERFLSGLQSFARCA